ncbi:alpha-ketoacid dehydrogenase subunit beta [bacterium]|nr:alpha-ketoacid dehydrogenase subunit beta [bacterium]
MKISFDWDKKSIEKDEAGFSHRSGKGNRKITYARALFEAFDGLLAADKRIFVMGQGVDDPFGMFGTTKDLHKKYGKSRVFDTPISEEGMTGIAIGAALGGMRPIYMHNRPDFLLLALNQIINHASKMSYMFGGKTNVPLVIWACIGRGWGSGAQHSQNLQGLFMHIPGLKIVMPSTPYDAKGLLVSSVLDENPVLILEHRWLLRHEDFVPEGLYAVPFGCGVVRKKGKDVTIVGVSYMIIEALRAAEELKKEKIDVEVIDLRTLAPLDEKIIFNSVKKTGRLVVVDSDWKRAGVTSEISALVMAKCFRYLKAPVKRVALPDIPTPASYILEDALYPGAKDIKRAVKEVLK